MKKLLIKWHRVLMWGALFSVLCWAISGITHPVMSWFGPQAQTRMPPTFQVDASVLNQLERVTDQLPIQQAAIAKVVGSQEGNLLQVTEDDDSPRRYFKLDTGEELPDYDSTQAKWLAAHYLNVSVDDVKSIAFRDSFGADYPAVNRLLPVYELEVKSGDDSYVAFIYTETGVLASLNNPFKATVQKFFRALHTWSWLDATGFGRVLIVGMLILTLLAMASSGAYMVFALPKRKIPVASRRWHRRFAYVLWIPLLAWSASGFYHLLQAEYVQPVSGVRLLKPVGLANFSVDESAREQWTNSITASLPKDAFLNSITLNQSIDDKPLYRLGIAKPVAKDISALEQRKARFAGQAIEKSSAFINAKTGELDAITDKDVAKVLAQSVGRYVSNTSQANQESEDIAAMSLVTHFGPTYDFRNKRLPVWQVDINNDTASRYFVDPVSGVLVDQNRLIDRAESFSFSFLHKWNLLMPLIGPEKRDILIVLTLFALITLSCFGFLMYRRRMARAAVTPQVSHTQVLNK